VREGEVREGEGMKGGRTGRENIAAGNQFNLLHTGIRSLGHPHFLYMKS